MNDKPIVSYETREETIARLKALFKSEEEYFEKNHDRITRMIKQFLAEEDAKALAPENREDKFDAEIRKIAFMMAMGAFAGPSDPEGKS